MARYAIQLSLPAPKTWGGRRRGAGRKLTPGRRPGVPHRPRLPHSAAHPVHVTLRATAAIRCLRAGRVFPRLRCALIAASYSGFRIIHYSVQDDHIHLIIEADDGRRLSRGMRGLAIRIARAVNGALGRRGPVWDERYHARALTTPRAVRHAIVYVLMNFKKHATRGGEIDPCSSGAWFDGCAHDPPPNRARRRPCGARSRGSPPSGGVGTGSSTSRSTHGRTGAPRSLRSPKFERRERPGVPPQYVVPQSHHASASRP